MHYFIFRQFQQRLVNNISLQIEDDKNPGLDFGDGEEKRNVLGRLKATKKSHVGTTRTGAISKGKVLFN